MVSAGGLGRASSELRAGANCVRFEEAAIPRRDGRVAEGARLESVYTARYPGFESLSLRHTLSQVAGSPANLSKQVTWTMCISRISCPFCTQFPSVPQILLTKGIWHYNGFSAVSKVLLSSIREIRCALPFPCPSSEGMNTRARRR